MSVKGVVRFLMRDPRFGLKPMAFSNSHQLILRVQSKLGRNVNPETVLRRRREIWAEGVY